MAIAPRGADGQLARMPLFWTVQIDRIEAAKRFDAEHFDPRFDGLEKRIKATGRWQELGDLATHIRRGAQPVYVADGDIIVLNSKHVGGLLDIAHAERTSAYSWTRNPRARTRKLDVLINSTGVGTIGRASCVLHEDRTVVDNHVTIIREIDPECDPVYLSVFLNSRLGMLQAEKWLSGSSGQVEIYPDDLRRFVILLPDARTQRSIRESVIEAYGSLVQAGNLMQIAEETIRREVQVT